MSDTVAIDTGPKNLEPISDRMERISLNSIRKVLPDRAITETCEAIGYVFRRRKITPIVTVLHMVLAAIWPEESFSASWQVMWDWLVSRSTDLSGQSPSSGSVSKARARLPREFWDRLFQWISEQAQRLSEPLGRWRMTLGFGRPLGRPRGITVRADIPWPVW